MKHPLKNFARFVARPFTVCAAAVLAVSLCGYGVMPCTAAEGDEIAQEDGAEVLTRGPVHEAFAATITFKPVAGITVPKAPPAAIEELPPDQRPEGDNVTWIPGYWAWDDENAEFLWVSGIWRNLPPGRQWMPGYWSESAGEFQWVSGYWADAAVEEVEYLPEPPPSIEAGPNIKRPSVDHSWMPGAFVWYQSRYFWRPGYWEVCQPDWVWVPSYYVRTPRGYIYVDGYYDYDVVRRGMIFAPMRFTPAYYARPGYHYRPVTVININVFTDHLFLRPSCRHYYFGDYYAPECRRSGYYSSHSYYSGGHGYDPIYAHACWSHRHEDHWERHVEENYSFYRDNKDERPPHTLVAFEKFNAKPDKNRRVDAAFVTPIGRLPSGKDSVIKLKPVNDDERTKFAQRGREIRDFGEQRKLLGTKPANTPDIGKPGKGESDKSEPVRVKVPRSPVMAKIPEQGTKDASPPKRREFVMPDDKSGDKLDPKMRPGGKPKVKVDAEPSDQPGRKKELDPNAPPKDGPKVDPRRMPKVEPKEEPKVDPRRMPKIEPKEEPKVDPRRMPKVEPKEEPRIDPRRAPKIEPKEPKTDPRSVPKAEPKAEPKREPKAEPKREFRPEPRVEPKREPRPEPKMEPKREFRPEPRVEPRREVQPQPRSQPQPQPQPKTDPQRQPKPESEEKNKRKKD